MFRRLYICSIFRLFCFFGAKGLLIYCKNVCLGGCCWLLFALFFMFQFEYKLIHRVLGIIKHAPDKATHAASRHPLPSLFPSSTKPKKKLFSNYFVDPKQSLKPFKNTYFNPSSLPCSRPEVSQEDVCLFWKRESNSAKRKVSLTDSSLADWEDTPCHGLECNSLTSSSLDAIIKGMVVKWDPKDPVASSF